VSGTYDGTPDDFIEMTVDVTVRANTLLADAS
jgi:hypothetical protein